MKKLKLVIAFLLACVLGLSGCGFRAGSGSGTGKPDDDQNIGTPDDKEENPSGGGSDSDDNNPADPDDDDPEEPSEEGEDWDGPLEDFTITVGSSGNPSYYFTSDGSLKETARDKQSTINTLSATDDFDRSFGYTEGFEEKYVCLFYFTWLGQHASEMTGIYDITKLLGTNPAALWSTTDNTTSPLRQYHYWGEPLYGYYNSLDTWVIRKHVELFVAAGIDVLVFDATNSYCYFPVVEQVANVLREYQDQGWKVPKFMFYTNSNSNATVRKLYQGTGNSTNGFERDGFYKNGNFSDLWFKPNGKPQIVAVSSELDSDLKAYFDVWESTWPDQLLSNNVRSPYRETGFPWMDWNGAPGHKSGSKQILGTSKGGVMSVSVAQHNRAPFSNAVNNMNNKNLATEQAYMWGRGYTKKGRANHTDTAINSGLNFEEEWQEAIANAANLKYVHVTGWNEWIASKLVDPVTQADSGAYFVDTVNREYSRDIEMMKGGYADNFYLQLARNVRAFKGVAGTQQIASSNAIDLNKGLTQWNAVTSVYDDFAITATNYAGSANRNCINFAGTATYTDNSMRNDVKTVRVTHDEEYVYFLVECVNDISGKPTATANTFMNLLIDVAGQDNENALGGYDYIVNRLSSFTGDCGVEKIGKSGTGLAYEQTGKGSFTISGKYMQFRVSKRSLGIRKNARFTIGFKIADNVANPADISSYYVSGECAPAGRLSFTYSGN